MNPHSLFAWFYWDPPREAFTIPYFDIVVVWYGILFATGFVAGYYILLPLLRNFFAESPEIYARDVKDWRMLASQMKNSASESSLPFYSALSKRARDELDSLSADQEPDAGLKQELLNALNTAAKGLDYSFNRKSLAKDFPAAIEPLDTLASIFADRVSWFIVIGTVVGARLGHVLFYGWDYYSQNPLEILMIRKGGLASHGGTLGIILALILFIRWNRKQFPEVTLVKLMDLLVIPTAVTVCFIRLANFFNQEILGNPTDGPWGVIFGHAADGTAPFPRHAVQLYEAAAYLATFVILFMMWKAKGYRRKPGVYSGLFFIFVFGSRFFIEYLKAPQSEIDSIGLQVGQWLSIPFVILGIVLLAWPVKGKTCGSCGTCNKNC